MRFAFYGRVSTEDRQSPDDSIAWQRAAATALTSAHGPIVVEYLDVGVSRSLPWPRRPEAARLLADCAARQRSFDAIVIGEPQRAFAGTQYGLTAPVLWHHGVALWVPEVGGAIDPHSEAHDLVMSLFGGLSQAERSRIQRRVRTAMATMARAGGRYLGGRPPYGYRLVAVRPHPNPEKARLGATLNHLEPDPDTAAIVQRIFAERIAGAGYTAIARSLNTEHIDSPAAHDPNRNPHRDHRGWSDSAVRAILANARYTGHEVWGRQHRDYQLLDPLHPADGQIRRMRWTDPDTWIWSPQPTHQPLVTHAQWQQAQTPRTNRARAPRASNQPYALRGRVTCAACGRRMIGTTRANNRRYYRCELRRSRPGAANNHPTDAYLREDALLTALDTWLEDLFAPHNAHHTAQLIIHAADPTTSHTTQRKSAHERIQNARTKLAQYRAALDAGADPATLTTWITEAATEERAATAELATITERVTEPLTIDEVLSTIDALGGISGLLADADPTQRAQLYTALGASAKYNPDNKTAELTVEPDAWRQTGVGGATRTLTPRASADGEFLIAA